jgi:uncharacterized membrane protein (UPF0127 family)
MSDQQEAAGRRKFRSFTSIAALLMIFFVSKTFLSTADTAKGQNAAFKKSKLTLLGKVLDVEIADNDENREQGLMFRTALNDSSGMLFIFDDPQVLHFWMKNTLIPLSIGYFDSTKKLIQILDMEPASPMDQRPTIYSSEKKVKYALEVNKGWFSKHNIKIGSAFKLQNEKLKSK